MKIRALFFDLDGLLFDTERLYCRFWQQAANEMGYEIPKKTLMQLRSCDSVVAAERMDAGLGVAGAYPKIRARRKELMSGYMRTHRPPLKSGVAEFMKKVSAYPDLKKLVVTQSATQVQKEEKEGLLRDAGILDCLDGIVTAAEVKRGKPFPDIYLYACGAALAQPDECIAYEDSPNGIEAASSAGVHAIMIPDLTQPDEALAERCFGIYPTILDSYEAIKPYLI